MWIRKNMKGQGLTALGTGSWKAWLKFSKGKQCHLVVPFFLLKLAFTGTGVGGKWTLAAELGVFRNMLINVGSSMITNSPLVVGGVENGGNCMCKRGVLWEISVPSAQVYCKIESAQEIKSVKNSPISYNSPSPCHILLNLFFKSVFVCHCSEKALFALDQSKSI